MTSPLLRTKLTPPPPRPKLVHRNHLLEHRLAKVAEMQVVVLLAQGALSAAEALAKKYPLPQTQARAG